VLDNVRTVAGWVRSLHDRPDEVTLLVDDGVDEEPVPVVYDVVVVATGFDPLWWRVLDDGTVEPALRRALGGGTLTQRAVERAVGHDLTITGLDPPLHVPMLAGLTQGPGFSEPVLPGPARRPRPGPLVRGDGDDVCA
jgi:mycobactin lysine-N-oxygenase